VTHDQEEALTLSDRIVVMEQGHVVQVGSPSEVYEHPRTRFVSDFIGLASTLKGKVASSKAGNIVVKVEGVGRFPAETSAQFSEAQPVEIVIRPEKVEMLPIANASPTCAQGRITNVVYTGAVIYCHVDIGAGNTVVAMVANENVARYAGQLSVGANVALRWKPEDIRVFAS